MHCWKYKNPNITIVKADKTRHIIIMNQEDYIVKMKLDTEEISHIIIKKNSTNNILVKLVKLKNHSDFLDAIKKSY